MESSLQVIQSFVAKHVGHFDHVMDAIEHHVESAKATNMAELKEKANNKRKKGDLFEAFCYLYLKHILEHDEVWFYKDFPMELKQLFHLTKNDYGIDIISRKGLGYYAIQCKFRKPLAKKQLISWKSLSTFYAMVSKSGPWVKHITMTNVHGCRHIGEKGEKDWSICIGTFRGMGHFEWLKMLAPAAAAPTEVVADDEMFETTLSSLRAKRLAYFDAAAGFPSR